MPSGKTRGIFSSKPPPVICAIAFTWPVLHRLQRRLHINARGLQQGFAEFARFIERGRGVPRKFFVGDDFAHQREAVAVRATGRDAEYHIAKCYIFLRQDFVALDRADRETGKVIITIAIHAGHFGGFAAGQGASGLLATFRNTRDDAPRGIHL